MSTQDDEWVIVEPCCYAPGDAPGAAPGAAPGDSSGSASGAMYPRFLRNLTTVVRVIGDGISDFTTPQKTVSPQFSPPHNGGDTETCWLSKSSQKSAERRIDPLKFVQTNSKLGVSAGGINGSRTMAF